MNWLLPAKGALICTLRIHIVRFAHVLAPLGLPSVALPAGQSQVHSLFQFFSFGGLVAVSKIEITHKNSLVKVRL